MEEVYSTTKNLSDSLICALIGMNTSCYHTLHVEYHSFLLLLLQSIVVICRKQLTKILIQPHHLTTTPTPCSSFW